MGFTGVVDIPRFFCVLHTVDIELLEAFVEADEDVKNGRVAPINNTYNDLRYITGGLILKHNYNLKINHKIIIVLTFVLC